MSYGRSSGTPLLGGAEVQALVGAWKEIIGSGAASPFRNIVGADTRVVSRSGERGGWGRREERFERPEHGGRGRFERERLERERRERERLAAEQGGGWDRPWVNGSRSGGGFAPRAMLVDQREPDRADRVILPMSSGDTIIVGDTGQITSRPQDVAFRPERIIIGQGTTPDGAADWVVSDIKVGNKSQLSQSGEIPGDMFDPKAIDAYVSFATVQTAMDFVMVVALNNAGDSNAAQFYCAVLGLAAVGG